MVQNDCVLPYSVEGRWGKPKITSRDFWKVIGNKAL